MATIFSFHPQLFPSLTAFSFTFGCLCSFRFGIKVPFSIHSIESHLPFCPIVTCNLFSPQLSFCPSVWHRVSSQNLEPPAHVFIPYPCSQTLFVDRVVTSRVQSAKIFRLDPMLASCLLFVRIEVKWILSDRGSREIPLCLTFFLLLRGVRASVRTKRCGMDCEWIVCEMRMWC